jgi:hypothetical protein
VAGRGFGGDRSRLSEAIDAEGHGFLKFNTQCKFCLVVGEGSCPLERPGRGRLWTVYEVMGGYGGCREVGLSGRSSLLRQANLDDPGQPEIARLHRCGLRIRGQRLRGTPRRSGCPRPSTRSFTVAPMPLTSSFRPSASVCVRRNLQAELWFESDPRSPRTNLHKLRTSEPKIAPRPTGTLLNPAGSNQRSPQSSYSG